MSASLPAWALPIADAALGAWAVIVAPDGGAPYRAGVYERDSVAQSRATRLAAERVDDARVFLVKRHRAGVTVYLSRDAVLGTAPA